MNDYEEWFKTHWNKHKGLITPKQAGDMLGLNHGSASLLPTWRRRGYDIYHYNNNNKPLIGYDDFLSYQDEIRLKKEKRKHKKTLKT